MEIKTQKRFGYSHLSGRPMVFISCHMLEGFKIGAPSTNNALESNNRVIQGQHTLRERMLISQFKEEAIRIVREWPLDYSREKKFIKIPSISLALWTEAYQ